MEPTDETRFCTIREAAELLRCSEATISRAIKAGTLSAVRLSPQMVRVDLAPILRPASPMADKVPLNVSEGAPCSILASSNCTIESGEGITLIGCHGVTENRDGALWVGNVDLTDLDDAEEIATALRTFLVRENARTTPDLDTVVGELQNLAVLFERQAELLEENPVIPPGFIKTYRKCAGKVRATIDRLGLNPYTESEALVGTHPEVVKLIRETSMASDQVGDELAFKVHSKLWDPTRFTPKWVQEKEYAFPLGMIRKLDEDEAWALIVRVLKQIGHY